jgi:AraC-like DNA-binding protein
MAKLSSINLEDKARLANYDPDSLAALCGVSLRHLQRFFRKAKGTTPSAWLLEQKCDRALSLIRQGYSNIAVVKELNFTSASELCRIVKRLRGVTPQSFAPNYEQHTRNVA